MVSIFKNSGLLQLLLLGAVSVLLALPFVGCNPFGSDEIPDVPPDQGCPHPELPEPEIVSAGLHGIVLTPGQKLIFQIDKSRTMHPLFMDKLVRQFGPVDIMITVEINKKGDIVKYTDFDYRGHKAAFDSIWASVKTWKYMGNCLEGELKLTFNTSSLVIYYNDDNLVPVEGFQNCQIERRQLHRVYRRSPEFRFRVRYR
jgi:hypothetical protein